MKVKNMITKSVFRKTSLFLAILSMSLLYIVPFTAHAAVAIATSPCDEKYYESLAARAWLEAQREITQNQNIILKPDSVFEYTCFDQLISELGINANSMLSGAGLAVPLANLVIKSLTTYVSLNFTYPSGGSLGGHPAGSGIKHVIGSSANYNCDVMKRVWKAAKCINFTTEPNYDGFFSFQNYATTPDKRHLPVACIPIAANWVNNIKVALTSGPWTNDPVQTYLSQIAAEDCLVGNCKCSGSHIPTGVKVTGQSPGPINYDEHICLQAGCRFHPGGAPLTGGGAVVGKGCYGK